MKNAFVFCTTDLHPVEHKILKVLEEEPILCWAVRHVEKLREADAIYFVLTETCLGSTAFWDVVESALAAMEGKQRWIIRLNETVVPPETPSMAANMLRSLPDGKPSPRVVINDYRPPVIAISK